MFFFIHFGISWSSLAEDLRKQLNFDSKGINWSDKESAYQDKGVKETAYISKPLQATVCFSFYCNQVLS